MSPPILAKLMEFDHGITAIDTDYVRPLLDASHLVVDEGHAAFVDTGTAHSVPNLLAALDAKGVARTHVDYVFTTHVHLDHAGGAGELLRHLPNASCVVHPRGARHLVDPSKLIAGTRAVYGDEAYARLYGELVPVPESRVVAPEDGTCFRLGARTFELIHTPGHAQHHYSLVDAEHGAIFAGDTFGVSYRAFDHDGHPFVIPTTTPVQFDPQALHLSIDRILSFAPRAVYITHYGERLGVPRLGEELKSRLDEIVEFTRRVSGEPDRGTKLREGLFAMLLRWLEEHGWRGGDALARDWWHTDIELNAQGLEVWLDRAG
jgi:glyoxylase-like metal-dependent hydrolase (beta-lactamase superfamily II)